MSLPQYSHPIVSQVACTSSGTGGIDIHSLEEIILNINDNSPYCNHLIRQFGERILTLMKLKFSFIRNPNNVLIMDTNGKALLHFNNIDVDTLARKILFERYSVIIEDDNTMSYIPFPMAHNSFFLSKGFRTLSPVDFSSIGSNVEIPTSFSIPEGF